MPRVACDGCRSTHVSPLLPLRAGEIPRALAARAQLAGAVVVTTPSALAVADVVRGVAMLGRLDVPVLALVTPPRPRARTALHARPRTGTLTLNASSFVLLSKTLVRGTSRRRCLRKAVQSPTRWLRGSRIKRVNFVYEH